MYVPVDLWRNYVNQINLKYMGLEFFETHRHVILKIRTISKTVNFHNNMLGQKQYMNLN